MKMRGPVAARRRPWRFVREAEESEGGQRKERERGIKYTSVEPLVFPRWTKRGRGGQREIGILNGPINGGGAPIGCSGCMRAQLDIEKTAVAGSLHQLHTALASFDEYVSSNWNEK